MKIVGRDTKLPISAIIPVRNGMQFLPNFLASNAEQFSKLDEVILINDNSSDGTLEYLNEFLFLNDNFIILDNPSPGLVPALNMGIKHSRNVWLARFDVDDVYSESRVEKQFAVIEDGVAAIFCDYEIVDSDENSLGLIGSPVSALFTELSLVNSRRTPHPSALLDKRAILSVGGYLESEHPAEDLGLWLRLIRGGFQLVSVPSILLKYRVHPKSVTSNNQAEMNRVRAELLSNHDFSKVISATINSFRKEVDKLRDTPLVNQRIFLSGVDLISARRLMRLQGAKNLPNLSVRSGSIFFSPKIMLSGFRYFFDARKRRNYRNF
jgi:glycosyltransferase involved in cell wall biosynthesis